MKRFFLITLAIPSALLAGKSDPGAPLIAADEAYDKASQRDGTWTATRAFSIPQSEIFIPQRVKTLEYGADAPDPPEITPYRADHAWISCDGTVGVTAGRWYTKGDKDKGYYEIIWGRLANGNYRILMQHAGQFPRKLFSRPGRKGMRAACGGPKPSLPLTAPDVGTDYKLGASHDQTLIYTSAVNAKGDVRIVISLWNGKAFAPVLEDVAPVPATR